MTPSLLGGIALAGKGVDLLGGCYLAYDLLDGRNGPLRGITRATVYLPLFVFGYATLLGPSFALVAAAGMAVALAIEFSFPEPPKTFFGVPALAAVLRGLVLGGAAALTFGPAFGIPFGGLVACGLLAALMFGLSPAQDHARQSAGLTPPQYPGLGLSCGVRRAFRLGRRSVGGDIATACHRRPHRRRYRTGKRPRRCVQSGA